MEFVWRNYVLVINGNYWVKTTNSIALLSQLMVFILMGITGLRPQILSHF